MFEKVQELIKAPVFMLQDEHGEYEIFLSDKCKGFQIET